MNHLCCDEHCSDPNQLQLGLWRFDHQTFTLEIPERLASLKVQVHNINRVYCKSFHVYFIQGPVNKVYGHVEGLLKKVKLNMYLVL